MFFVLCAGLFFTAKGSALMVKLALSGYSSSTRVDISETKGTLFTTMYLNGVSIENPKWLPEGSSVNIEKLDASVRFHNLRAPLVNIINGKINLPDASVLFFNGSYKNSVLKFNIYSSGIDIKEILALFKYKGGVVTPSGILNNPDVYIEGTLTEPELKGRFDIGRASFNGFLMENCPVFFDLKLKNIGDKLDIRGEVLAAEGAVSGQKTAVITLQESKILFNGEPRTALFDFKGTSIVEGVKINISLKGSKDNPDLNLFSDPPFSKGQLLLMLATNKSWSITRSALGREQISPDIAGDFLDYFVFSGQGGKIARYFGITDVWVKYNAETRGAGFKKKIFDNANVSYSVEQSWDKENAAPPVYKLGTEYNMTDNVSIEAEKELKRGTPGLDPREESPSDDKVLLKYKKGF
jgi:hypothetical protein